MALINRISRLFKADFNAVIDQIEEPELLLKQSVREMEDELARQERAVAQLAHEKESLTSRREEIAATARELDEELDVCFESGKEDLARVLVGRKLQAERLQKRIEARLESNRNSADQLERRLQHNRTTLESMRQKADVLAARTDDVSGDDRSSEDGFLSARACVDDHDVEVAFLREKAKRATS